MSDYIRSLVKEHHAFYQVSPYYLLLEERHGSSTATTRRVQAGFDLDIYAENLKPELAFPGPDPDYALGYNKLKKIAETVSRNAGSCSIEVISFPSRVIVDNRNHGKVEGTFRIRISHRRGLDQPAGLAEQHVLEELENQLNGLGIARR